MTMKDLPKREIELKLLQIKSLIESGGVKKMRDLKDSSSTKIASYAGINQGRYSSKLINPGEFTVSEIHRISYVLGIDPKILMEIITREIMHEEAVKVNANIEKEKLKK